MLLTVGYLGDCPTAFQIPRPAVASGQQSISVEVLEDFGMHKRRATYPVIKERARMSSRMDLVSCKLLPSSCCDGITARTGHSN